MVAPAMSELSGRSLGTRASAYDERDVMLYALTVGARADELELVYERNLRVLPTFALPLGLWAVEVAGGLGAYDDSRSLHVGQELTVIRALPPSGTIEMTGAIANVWDKGSAALVELVATCDYFVATYLIFVPGAGGFGGERGPSASQPTPTGDPSWTTAVTTMQNQAVLYRLTGDRHPVHVDPEAARASGFDRPILHGLCTLGAVALEMTRVAGSDPTDLAALTARFSAPVLPGATIGVSGWEGHAGTTYVASVAGVGPVLSGTLRRP